MLKNILNTFFTKIITAVLSLMIVIINSKQLGAGGVGEISLVVLSVSIYLLINEFFSGAFVYFIPKENNFQLLIISYVGIVLSLVPFSMLYLLIPLAPLKYFYYVIGLSVIFALSNINQLILLGREAISEKNLILFIQIISVFLSLIYFFYYVKEINVYSYIYSLYAGYTLALITGWLKIRKYIALSSLHNIRVLFLKVFYLGTYNAVSNLIQKMNYRLSYYLIEYFLGIHALGRFSVGVQVSESTWLIGQSVASVQYARIANLDNKKSATGLSVSLLKITFLISLVIIVFFAILPEYFYRLIFGAEFTNINLVIIALAPGIVVLSCNMILSHYFSGTGRYKINTIASAIGFVFIAVFGFLLIPEYGLLGAGIAMSVSYTASTVYLLIKFIRHTQVSFTRLFITQDDFKTMKSIIKQLLSKNP